MRGERAADVPCEGCTACCRSSQFVHIAPDETETLARIPAELLFPAPLSPPGHVVLGYDERGHCPMLVDDRCSIYAFRPRTCQRFDCRVFAASGVAPDSAQVAVADRAARWRFHHGEPEAAAARAAVQAAARFLERHRGDLPGSQQPTTIAVLAIRLHHLFLAPSESGGAVVEPDLETVRREIEAAGAELVEDPSGRPWGRRDR